MGGPTRATEPPGRLGGRQGRWLTRPAEWRSRRDAQPAERPAGEDANALALDFPTRAAHVKVMSPGTCRVRSELADGKMLRRVRG